MRLSKPHSFSGRLEREARRNVELIWLLGHLVPDFKTIADFRRDNGPAMPLLFQESRASRMVRIHRIVSVSA